MALGKISSISVPTFAASTINTTMEKNIILSQENRQKSMCPMPIEAHNIRLSIKKAWQLLLLPLSWLRHYYGSIIGKEISFKETAWLLHAQLSFVITFFAIELSWLTRIACFIWLLYALFRCKQIFD